MIREDIVYLAMKQELRKARPDPPSKWEVRKNRRIAKEIVKQAKEKR